MVLYKPFNLCRVKIGATADCLSMGQMFVNIVTPTSTMSVGVGRTFEVVCLFVCLSVCPQHNSKTNDRKVFKLGVRMTLGYPKSDMVLRLKGQKSTLGLGSVIWRGFEVYKCLLV